MESDLTDERAQLTGRTGLPVESALRCAILKQTRQLSYKELVFYLEDSSSFRSFARLPEGVVQRQETIYGRLPESVAADGDYASTANLDQTKALGVSEVAFQKKKGLTIEAMTSSKRVYK